MQNTMATSEFTPEAISSVGTLEHQLTEMETLIHEMKRLQVKSEMAFEHEGIRTDMETLERWMESYRRGLSAARKLSTAGTEILDGIRNKLKLAIEELLRLEDEGGNPASRQQATELEELVAASRRLDRMIPNIEHLICMFQHEHDDKPKLTENA